MPAGSLLDQHLRIFPKEFDQRMKRDSFNKLSGRVTDAYG